MLEYNARFGDLEAQVVLPRMKIDPDRSVREACVDGTLDQIDLEFEDNAAVVSFWPATVIPVPIRRDSTSAG